MRIISDFFNDILSKDVFSICLWCLLIVNIIVNLTCFLVRKSKNFFSAYCIINGFVILLRKGVESILEIKNAQSIIMLALSVLFSLPFIIKRNEKKVEKSDRQKEKEFIKFIDKQIFSNLPNQDVAIPQRRKEEVEKEQTLIESQVKDGLDFSHVKNILKRLDYFELKENDKRQVRELENTLFLLERGDNRFETKEKLNDALNALLKIMARYGV